MTFDLLIPGIVCCLLEALTGTIVAYSEVSTAADKARPIVAVGRSFQGAHSQNSAVGSAADIDLVVDIADTARIQVYRT